MLMHFTELPPIQVDNHKNKYNMGRGARKPVFRISDKVRFKPACSATETSSKNEISLIASLDIILSNKRITKVLIHIRIYHESEGWDRKIGPEDHTLTS